MFQSTLPLFTPRYRLDPSLITSVHDTIICEQTETGSNWSSHGSIDHPSFTRLRKHLAHKGYISMWEGVSNGDRVLEEFYLNDVLFRKGDKFFCAAAMSFHLERAEKHPMPKPEEPHYDALLKEWKVYTVATGVVVHGLVYGDSRFPDGSPITTSLVKSINKHYVTTQNTVYKLC